MATKKEDVLLQVEEVRYKKTDGTLYILDERIAFMNSLNSRALFSSHFKDIKSEYPSIAI
jgi:transcription initiation factor TFIIH subunit 1